MPSHRRPPQRRFRGGYRSRRGPARLTLIATAATMLVGGISAGVAVAAAPPGTQPGVAAAPAAPGIMGVGSGHGQSQVRRAQPSQQAAGSGPPAPGSGSEPARSAAQPGHEGAQASHSGTPAASARPYLVFDSILPGALPSGHEIATYATGPHAVTPAELAGRGPVLWIDVLATDPAAAVLDVEPGCATPSAVPTWVSQRLAASPRALAIIYTSQAEWPLVQAEVAGLPTAMRAQVRWWIADPTGYPHLVPGSDATQWYWGTSYDISTATPRF